MDITCGNCVPLYEYGSLKLTSDLIELNKVLLYYDIALHRFFTLHENIGGLTQRTRTYAAHWPTWSPSILQVRGLRVGFSIEFCASSAVEGICLGIIYFQSMNQRFSYNYLILQKKLFVCTPTITYTFNANAYRVASNMYSHHPATKLFLLMSTTPLEIT